MNVDVIRTRFVDGLQDFLRNKVDILIFNPPYVPTPSEEINSIGIEAAWAGGVDGREIIDLFIPMIKV